MKILCPYIELAGHERKFKFHSDKPKHCETRGRHAMMVLYISGIYIEGDMNSWALEERSDLE